MTAMESFDKETITLSSHVTTLNTASNRQRKLSAARINKVQEMIKVRPVSRQLHLVHLQPIAADVLGGVRGLTAIVIRKTIL